MHLRRPVDARSSAAMAGVNVPLVSVQHQYIITEPIAGVTPDLPTLRDPDRLHLLQGGGRRAGDGRLRAEPDALGRATACPTDFEFQLLDDDWDHFEPIMELALGRVPALRDRRHQAADQRPGELHARRQLHPRRGAGDARTSSSAPASTPSASPPAAAPAWRWPNGSPRASRRSTSGRSTSAASAAPHRDTGLGAHAHARGLRQALHDGLAVRGVRQRPAAAPLAALRPAARRRAPCFGEKLGWERPNWFAGRRRGAARPLHATAGRTGSRRSAASTAPAASAVGAVRPDLVRQVRCWSAATPRRRCPGSAPTTSPSRRAA